MNYDLAPVALFVYNRPIHTLNVLQALKNNELSDHTELYIFADGPKLENDSQVAKVREVINSFQGFKNVHLIINEVNKGLASSIIDGISAVLKEHERVIVLEDDIVTSPVFLKFMNEALETYKFEEKVISINAYMYPINNLPSSFFLKNADCWGWATWRRGWNYFEPNGTKLLNQIDTIKKKREFDFDGAYPYWEMLKNQIEGKNNSWAVRWYASAFTNEKLGLFVGKSLIKNIGLDHSGENCGYSEMLEGEYSTNIPIFSKSIQEDIITKNKISLYLKGDRSILKKFLKRVYAKFKN